MPRKTRKADHDEPATKGFVRDAIDNLASAVKIGFDHTATKDDLAALDSKVATLDDKVTTLDSKVTTLDGKFTKLDAKVNRLERGQKAMLGILDENNQLLKEIRRLPERVARLEQSVFR